MPWKTSLLAVALAAFASSAARAVDFGPLLPWHACWPNCITKTCCDDYCPKPMPCVLRIDCFGCDDYMPQVRAVRQAHPLFWLRRLLPQVRAGDPVRSLDGLEMCADRACAMSVRLRPQRLWPHHQRTSKR